LENYSEAFGVLGISLKSSKEQTEFDKIDAFLFCYLKFERRLIIVSKYKNYIYFHFLLQIMLKILNYEYMKCASTLRILMNNNKQIYFHNSSIIGPNNDYNMFISLKSS